MTTSTRQAYPTVDDLKVEMSRLNFDPDFARLLEGRDVAVVGPAATMLGTGRGPEIDSFDVVVRFNTAIEYMPFAEGLARDIGARTDVLYCNTEVLIDDIVGQQRLPRERFLPACEAAGIKYFVGTNNDFTRGATEGGRRKGEAQLDEFRKFVEAEGARARCRMLYSTPPVVRRWLGGYIGRTGFIGIVDLLRYGVRRLHVTGMTFYHKGGHLFLTNCVGELDPLRNHLGILPEHMLGHNSYVELRVMRALAEYFGPRLQLDEHVLGLMEAGAAAQRPEGG
jgi:hypothetical protein